MLASAGVGGLLEVSRIAFVECVLLVETSKSTPELGGSTIDLESMWSHIYNMGPIV